MAIAEATANAATENIYKHSMAYSYEDKATGQEMIASGTLIRLGKRLLVATVRHTNPRGTDSIDLVKRARLLSPLPTNYVIRRE